MKKIFFMTFLLSIVLFNNTLAQQIYAPNNTDEYDNQINENKVINTGNDILDYEYFQVPYKMQVTVSDGDDPHFIYKNEDPNGISTLGTIEIDNSLCPNSEIIDPDVVLVNHFWLQTTEALTVYETQNGEINLVIKQFDQGSQTWIYPPNYQQGINIGDGTNPNIDISTAIDPIHSIYPAPHPNPNAKFVIVWEDHGNIKSIAGECDYDGNYIFGQTTTIYNTLVSRASLPDVTISYLDTNTQVPLPYYSDLWTVTYTFLIEKNDQLLVHQEDFYDVFNGNISSSNLVIRHTFGSTDIMGVPRIASPDNAHGQAPYRFDDYTVVMGGVIDPQPNMYVYRILGFNKHFGQDNDYWYEYSNTPNVYEGKLVVCYAGDLIIIAWEIDAWSGNTVGLVKRDVIQRQLTYNGSAGTNYYSRVNMEVTGNQYIPSVAASYSYDVLYSFLDEEINHVRFKDSHCNNQYLRIGKPQISYGIFPNPTCDILNVNIDEDALMQIFDMAGRMILEQRLSNYSNTIDLQHLESGTYLLKLITLTSESIDKIIVQ